MKSFNKRSKHARFFACCSFCKKIRSIQSKTVFLYMGRPTITSKHCETCNVTSESNPTMVFYTSKICRPCCLEKRRQARAVTSPVKRRVRVAKPSVCKHCHREPSEGLKFKSTFLCVECQFKRFTPEEFDAYQQHVRNYKKLYSRKLSKTYKMFKQGLLKPVESSVVSISEQSSASSVVNEIEVEK